MAVTVEASSILSVLPVGGGKCSSGSSSPGNAAVLSSIDPIAAIVSGLEVVLAGGGFFFLGVGVGVGAVSRQGGQREENGGTYTAVVIWKRLRAVVGSSSSSACQSH